METAGDSPQQLRPKDPVRTRTLGIYQGPGIPWRAFILAGIGILLGLVLGRFLWGGA